MLNCRFCNNYINLPFLSLGNAPFSNSYLAKNCLNQMEPYYPLELYLCQNCFLVQLGEFETTEKIFNSDYAYFSSYSDTWLNHMKKYSQMIIEKLNLNTSSFVVEIGSNDGYLLQYFVQNNIPVLGIDPSEGTSKVALSKNIPVEIKFFNKNMACEMKESNRQADLIIGNNVLAHNPQLNDFVAGLKIALKPEGIITMEFPHLLRFLEGCQFDTVYHEHFSYFSLYTVQKLFAFHGLELFDVDELSTHGGSLRIYAKHIEDSKKDISHKISEIIELERKFGLFNSSIYFDFKNKVEKIKRDLLSFLINEKNNGKRIVGYGAPAKGNTLFNYCGIKTDFIDYTVDRSPHKQDKYLPGSHIPIKAPETLKNDQPDYVLILPWNLKEEIMEQMSYIRNWGGKFIVAIPALEII